MDGSIRTDLDAKDIIARIMADMEEVMDLIQRPTRGHGVARAFPLPLAGITDQASGQSHPDV